MQPIPTPAMREVDYDKSLYYGPAMAQLRILKQQMQLGGLKIGSRTVEIVQGVTCFCNICYGVEEVYIRLVTKDTELVLISGFICHPRTATDVESALVKNKYCAAIRGGWENGITELTTIHVYPLYDSDNASYLLSLPTFGFVNETGSYGNMVWHNADASICISYKGIPTRHFINERDMLFGDFCADTFYGGYGYIIYKMGVAYVNGPQSNNEFVGIRGAAITSEAIYTICGTAVYKAFVANRVDTNIPWDSIGTVPDSPQWFFSQSGLKAISTTGHTIEINADGCTVVERAATYGSRNITGVNDMSYSCDIPMYFEYAGNTIVSARLCASGTLKTEQHTTSTLQYSAIGKYLKNPPDFVSITMTSNSLFVATYGRTDGLLMTIPSDCGETTITWGGPVVDLHNGTARLESVCYPPGNHVVTVTATVSGPGFSIAGTVDITIVGAAGWWEPIEGLCTYKGSRSNACGGESTVYTRTISKDESDYYIQIHGYYEVVTGRTMTSYTSGRFSQKTYSSGYICECYGIPHESGYLGGNRTITRDVTIEMDSYIIVNGTIYCNYQGNDPRKITPTSRLIEYFVTDIPWKSYEWVCA